MEKKRYSGVQLFYIEKDQILLNKESLELIVLKFDKLTPIAVAVVCGITGQGKSTWLNSMCVCSTEFESKYLPFSVDDSNSTHTRGVWVYPYPLFS